MQNYTATVASKPKMKKALLEFKIKLDDSQSDKDAVAFNNDIDKLPEFKDLLINLAIGDTISFVGFENFNNYKGCNEIVIKSPDISPELTLEEIMSMPAKDLIAVDQRFMETKKYTFPDGNFFYSDGIYVWKTPDHKVKATYKFIEGYNQRVTRDKWLIPDWFAVEQIKIMKEDPVQLKLAEAFSTW